MSDKLAKIIDYEFFKQVAIKEAGILECFVTDAQRTVIGKVVSGLWRDCRWESGTHVDNWPFVDVSQLNGVGESKAKQWRAIKRKPVKGQKIYVTKFVPESPIETAVVLHTPEDDGIGNYSARVQMSDERRAHVGPGEWFTGEEDAMQNGYERIKTKIEDLQDDIRNLLELDLYILAGIDEQGNERGRTI